MTITDITNQNQKKRTQTDEYTCGLIIGRFQLGQNVAGIQRDMEIPRSTIVDCIDRYKKTGTGVIKKRTGRALKLSERDQRTLVRSFRAEPFLPFVAHNEKLKSAGINIHPQTLIKYAAMNGFASYSPAYVPKLTPNHMKKRLLWAKDKVNWTPEQWRNVIWSDESKFNVQGSDGRVRVIRKEGERYHPDMVKKTVKFGNGSVMIWGCFWAGGLGPLVVMKGTINQEAYINCLSNHFLPWLEDISSKESRDFLFQEDGASCHTGSYAAWYKQRCGVEGFDFWPAQSPDLNPIEHVWAYLEKRIERRRYQIKNVDQLEAALRDEWYNTPLQLLENLVESMNSRCKAVIEAKGGNTRY